MCIVKVNNVYNVNTPEMDCCKAKTHNSPSISLVLYFATGIYASYIKLTLENLHQYTCRLRVARYTRIISRMLFSGTMYR